MKKQNKIQTPDIYNLLSTPTKEGASRKIIIATDRKIHSFLNQSVPVPPEIGIDMEFTNFDDLTSRQSQVILALHEEFFKSEPPKKQEIFTSALYLWAYFIKEATPHLANTTVTGELIRKSSYATRQYSKGSATSDTTALKTPQARMCYTIFLELLGNNPSVTEENLKKEVYRRAPELKTRQDAWRIFQYYRPKLIEAKLLKHD